MIYFDSEKVFEDLLFDNQYILSQWFGIHPSADVIRQLSLKQYGICDLFTIFERELEDGKKRYIIEIIELKNTPIKSEHIIQCARYKTFFDNLNIDNSEIKFICHLVGLRTFTDSKIVDDLVFLCQSIDWLKVYETTLSPHEGLQFDLVEGWHTKNSKGEKETKLEGVNNGEV